ncbi:MAG: pyridoxamine 5'-phosphate oxidase [Arenimonas sp.]|nr:pyridoxamine 5'-phosphate oxidase [Arenimonas sp.]
MDALYKQALETFNALLEQAQQSQDPEPTAMTVATVGRDGRPAARTVLLKTVDERGFVFFTNFNSRKGRQLAANPQAALLFHWRHLQEGVQVKIEGTVEPVSAAEADDYFRVRPRGSQIGAWASLQSEPLASRELFEQRVAEVEQRYEGMDVPRPPHWSGFRIVPERIEFWYGARFRLHERQCYERVDGVWSLGMLYP